MRISKIMQDVFIVSLACAFLGVGCAPRNPSLAAANTAAPARTPTAQHCPDRVDRARVGGFVGTIVGALAATLIGAPFLAGTYKVAGYVMGFASGSSCPKGDTAVEPKGAIDQAELPASTEIKQEDL